MSGKEMILIQNSDGIWGEYDGAYDITIHCESEEEQKKVLDILERRQWVACTERVPEEGEKVLACDIHGNMLVGWVYSIGQGYTAESDATAMRDCVAWMPLPERYEV